MQIGVVGTAPKENLAPYPARIMADSTLLGFWEYDEGAGRTVSYSRKGPNGTYKNGSHHNVSLLGSGGGVPGGSQAVSSVLEDAIIYPDTAAFNTYDAWSIAFWHKRPTAIMDWECLMSRVRTNPPVDDGFSVWYSPQGGGVGKIELDISTGGPAYDLATESTDIIRGNVSLYILTFDGSAALMRIIKDGHTVATTPTATGTFSPGIGGNLYVGQYATPGVESYSNYLIDDLSIHGRAIPEAEAMELYNLGKP